MLCRAVYMKAWGKSQHTINEMLRRKVILGGLTPLVPFDNYMIPYHCDMRVKTYRFYYENY